MAKRINVILDEETGEAIHRAAKSGERSRFINRAVWLCCRGCGEGPLAVSPIPESWAKSAVRLLA